MGREIEMKIPLSHEDFVRLEQFAMRKSEIKDVHTENVQKIFKKDEYFSRYKSRQERISAKEPQVIRIRTESYGNNQKSFFCIKRKSLENGVELNREDETFVEDISVVRDILNLGGFEKWFEKEKDSLSVHCRWVKFPQMDFHLEVEKVNSLEYAEIEVCDGIEQADVVRSSLEEFVRLLNLNPDNREARSWVQIINGESL